MNELFRGMTDSERDLYRVWLVVAAFIVGIPVAFALAAIGVLWVVMKVLHGAT